jgi:hypothetical protein
LPDLIHGLEANFYRTSEAHRENLANAVIAKGIYFRSLGYTRIALLGLKSKSFIYDLLQYINWVNHEKIPNLLELVEDGCRNFDCIIDRWLPLRGELAVIICDDVLALDFMDCCTKRDLAVPDDIAIMGQGNNPEGIRSTPSLSTTFFPYDCIADGMLSYALLLSGGSCEEAKEIWPLVFHVRESCSGRKLKKGRGTDVGSPFMDDLYKNQERPLFCNEGKRIPVLFEKEQKQADGLAYA